MEYSINVENNAKNELYFPDLYGDFKQINVFEPLYNNIKNGDVINFKIEADLDKIIIIDKKWIYLNKNNDGIFEKKITIESKKGEKVIIAKETSLNHCSYLASYLVK